MAAKPLKSSHKVLATCYWMHGSSHFGDESGQEKGWKSVTLLLYMYILRNKLKVSDLRKHNKS